MAKSTIATTDMTIRRGDVFLIDDEAFRVLEVNESITLCVSLINPEIAKFDSKVFLRSASNQQYVKTPNATDVCIHPKENQTHEAKRRQDIFENILFSTYPEWNSLVGRHSKKNAFDDCANSIGITKAQCRRLFLRYLRSGRDMFSLVDRRALKGAAPRQNEIPLSSVSPSERFRQDKILDEALRHFKKSLSITAAYHHILREYYMEPVYTDGCLKYALTTPESERISYRQIYYYISNGLGGRTVKEYIKGEKEYRNNHRPLRGNARFGLPTIGNTFLLDECELDVYIVSESDPNQVIGKPIMYCAVDPYADMIVGVSVGLQNNSYSGFCDLMITMLEPHNAQTSTVGITCSEEDFPSMIMPKEIRADHGSEYESYYLAAAMSELGIRESLVPVAAGSYKGLVENVFQRIQHTFRRQLYDAGYIMKTHEGPSVAREKACLTLTDVRMIIYRIVIDLNTTPLPGYSLSREMMEAGVDASPKSIWQYEINRCGSPVNVGDHNRDRILFALLRHDKQRRFKVTRAGIEYVGHNLRYFSDEEWFLDLIKQPNPSVDIRYNDLLVDNVYVLYRKRLHKVPLAMKREELKSFCGMSWYEYDELYRFSRNAVGHEKALTQKLNTEAEIEMRKRLAKAMRFEDKNRTKDIKSSRKAESINLSSDPRETRNRLLSDTVPNPDTVASHIAPKNAPIRRIPEEELLRMLEDTED